MADSGDEGSGDEGLGFTSFLFGNIDDSGKLDKDSDLFDDESKAHLAALQKLGFGSFIKEVVSEGGGADGESSQIRSQRRHDGDSSDEDDDFLFDDDDDFDRKPRGGGSHSPTKKPKGSDGENNFEGSVQKLPDAVDFFDMEELAEEDRDDAMLMPPPPPRTGFGRGRSDSLSGDDAAHKLNTPLAAMLPSKYADRNVTELFPEFRPNKVLRFSRLFGPGKPSSLPQIWRGVKRKRKRKLLRSVSESASSPTPLEEETSQEPYEWKFDFAPPPPLEEQVDNEAEFLRPMEYTDGRDPLGRKKDTAETTIAPWRHGPAQLWFDVLDVPESGDGFTYGFKTKKRQKAQKSHRRPGRGGLRNFRLSMRNGDGDGDSSDSEDEESKKKAAAEKSETERLFPDDVFFMVNQINWEDDVIWNGDEVKNKVMQKLQSKPNAAGWIPSSMMRTAQSLTLSQPVKGATGAPVPSTSAAALAHQKSGKMANAILVQDDGDDTWYSIFPVENEELIYKRWEDDVIWDAENMDRIPEPKVVTLDPNDENIILGIPDDIDPSTGESTEQVRTKTKIPHPHVRKSKMLLGKAGVIHQIEEDSPPPPPKSPDKDPYNISNDDHYMPKAEPNLKSTVSSTLIQHSIPVVELRAPFVPTHLGPVRLRAFHRPGMKRYSHGPLSQPLEYPVFCLASEIQKKAQEREQERLASGGGEVFFMRTSDDLTAKDGELIFCEYAEEHPPLIMQVGMCTKLKNYYKRRAVKDRGPPEYKYGETAYAHTSPFLGHMHPGQSIQTLENNLFRAPMYEHPPPRTDFLLIRLRNGYYLRDVKTLYCVGQECPLYEVPGPNSKRANNFVRDFLQVFIYRLFWSSPDTPRRIRMDDIKRAFPSHSESSIRKRLKLCADFKRTGSDSNWWVQRPDFRLPTEEELRALVSPEQCCAYFSMIAAEQRLRDAGYGEKFLLIAQDDDDEDMQMKMEDEVKVAPWNTTRAYIQAAKGKCLLQLTGPADPTGCGEGFSYIRVPNKPQQNKEEVVQEKRTVTGTDADLRRLSLRDAKALLRKFDVPEEEIKKLSRWEVIDVVRTLSTEKAKAGEEGMTKFSRGNRFSIAEHQERYKEECQRIFDLQNKVLSSSEILSSDEASSSDEDNSDMEDMSKNLEKMLTNKKTSSQLTREREEQERRELRRMLMEESTKKKSTAPASEESQEPPSLTGRKLRITRTFRKANGDLFSRTEIVRNPAVIDAYVKIRQTKDDAFIRQFATPDDAQKEEMKREKRRIQEQLRRIKKNQERGAGRLSDGGDGEGSRDGLSKLDTSFASDRTSSPLPGPSTSSGTGGPFSAFAQPSTSGLTSSAKKKKKEEKEPKEAKAAKLKPDLKLKCGACGQVGHMRTNKACPLYTGAGATGAAPPVPVAMTEQQMEEELEKDVFNEDEQLVNVEGTKVTFSSNLIKQAEELKRKSLLLKFPKKTVEPSTPQTATSAPPPPPPISPREPTSPPMQFSQFFQPMSSEPKGQPPKKKRRTANENLDYLKRVKKPAQRRRIDPLVAVSTVFEDILKEMSGAREAAQFLYPVPAKLVPDYYRIISQPMDLQKMKENNRARMYQSREDFLQDASLIVHNSSLYNGPNHPLTHDAQSLLKICIHRLSDQEQKLMDLEKSINPLLDDNSKVALSFLLGSVLQNKIKVLPESYPFHKPVNKKNVKDYFSVIDQPMDLETIEKKIKEHKYLTGRAFLRDMEQIYLNSSKYNGEDSLFTQQAKMLVEVAKSTLAKYQEPLNELERKIRAAAASDHGAADDYSSGSESDDADDEMSRASGSHVMKSELIIKDDPEAGPSGMDTGDYYGHGPDEMEVEDSYDPEAQLLLEFGGPRHIEPGFTRGAIDSAFEDARSSFDDSQDHRAQEADMWTGISF